MYGGLEWKCIEKLFLSFVNVKFFCKSDNQYYNQKYIDINFLQLIYAIQFKFDIFNTNDDLR